jgi:glycosyltransferase involved in cell wall biosynthesis
MIPVSVAMATYNGQLRVRRQLDSLIAQSQLPAELVVSDDASDDDTIAIIEAFAKTSPFPVVIHRNETRLGFRANFMRAAKLCRSELIAFCDQDDFWYPNKIALSAKPFSDLEVLLAYHNADVVTDDGRRIGSLAARAAQKPILTPLLSKPWLYALGFTMVFRRSLLQLSDLWPNSRNINDSSQPCGHDQWFFFLSAVFGKIAYLDEALAAYVQHGNNAYGWTKFGFFDLMKFYFCNRAYNISKQANAADSWAVILRMAKSNLAGDWSDRAATASEYYGRLSSLYELRSSLYTSAHLIGRLRAFGKILERNGYAGAWSLGRKSFIADLCLGVPLAPFLPRLSPSG